MSFNPIFEKKKKCPKKLFINPFPTESVNKFKAFFNGFNVEVFDKEDISNINKCDLYGKGSHSRSSLKVIKQTEISSRKFSETLILDLEESFFLAHILGVLDIYDKNEKLLTHQELFDKFLSIKSKFPYTLAAYLYLKSKFWTIKSGTKFGCDFLIYRQGPQYYHASFTVFIKHSDQSLESKDIQGIQRIAETNNKDVLILEVTAPNNTTDYFNDLYNFTISEIIPKRFDYKNCVNRKTLQL